MTDQETAAAAAAITDATTPTATPTATPTPTPAPVPVALPPTTVSIPADQLQNFLGLQSRIAQLETENRTREAAAADERVRILTEKNDAVNAVKTVREQHAIDLKAANDARVSIEDSAKRYALDGAISRVLAAAPLTEGSAEQLTQLWRGEFQVHPENGTFTVRTATFQTVEQFVAEKLALPAFAKFVRANHPAGGLAGTTGAHHAGPTPGHQMPEGAPRTLDEAIRLHVAAATRDGADGRTNPRLPMPMRPMTG